MAVRIRRRVRSATRVYLRVSLLEHQARTRTDYKRFNGSAGTAVIPSSAVDEDALLFVDSRYWIQAEKQVPKAGWKVVRVGSSGGSGAVSVEKGWTEWLFSVSDSSTRSDGLADVGRKFRKEVGWALTLNSSRSVCVSSHGGPHSQAN